LPTTLSRVTPITLALRGDYRWLAHPMRRDAEQRGELIEKLAPSTAQVLAMLREHGALFFAELLTCSQLGEAELREALWDGVARGLLTADGFGSLRSLLGPTRSRPWASAHAPPMRLRRGARNASSGMLSGMLSGIQSGEGRWALVPLASVEPFDPDELAEAAAEQLLARWGVVFRDLVVREALCVPWRDISWALRRLEARGLVRGGRFVHGFVGEQYALPEAVELLRSVRRAPRDGGLVRIAGCDPLNLTGVILPGPRVPALRKHELLLRDGARVEEGSEPHSLLQ
jgi:ATP-dependent Lhr-like helicase